jgi:WD40 repeat protein
VIIKSEFGDGLKAHLIMRGPKSQKPSTRHIKVLAHPILQWHLSIYFIDWVRDVAFAPNNALPYCLFASCSEDRSVYIWRQKDRISGPWEPMLLKMFEAPVWRLSWSVTGTVLAVSCGDHKVTLWKQSVDESWVQISNVGEN